jgi:hypothetical protein
LKNPQKKIVIFLFCFFTITNYAQTINGIVEDENGNPLNAKLLIKDSSTPSIISEFVLVVKGKYSYVLKKKYENNIIIQASSTGYSSSEKLIYSDESSNILEINFRLFKEKIQKLDEVYLEGKKSFNIKEDTIIYRVDSFKDGSEKKLEDLLKKLPGIEVNEDTGLIKYMGKPIETVMIEGDNLFDYNYTIGTKNINIDLVKEIEAIENYSENSLLKGIEFSNKVALNLKLKENKVDISGNIDFATGFFDKRTKKPINTSLNLLGINKIYKSFAVATYNNIGLNLSPFNYFSEQINFEQIREEDYYAQKIIPELGLTKVTSDNLSNINNQFFSNFNSIFNLNKELKAKINLFYINDEINSNQFSTSNFVIDNEFFETFDNSFVNKKPTQYRGDLELKLITSKSSLLKYDMSIRDETIETNSSIFSNQENDFTSFLRSNNSFFKQRLQYTKRLSEKKALQINFLHSINKLTQNYEIEPSIFSLEESNKDIQTNNPKKNNLNLNAIFLGSSNKNNYSFTFGVSNSNESFVSSLYSTNGTDNILFENGINDLNYEKNEIRTLGSYNWKLGKFNISPNYSLRYLNQSLSFIESNTSIDTDLIIFEPSLDINYKINRISSINGKLGINRNTNSLQNLFPNTILINNRLTYRNTPSLALQKNQSFGISYDKNDLFNQLEMSFGINYLKQKGGFFSNSQIDANSSTIENFFLQENTENINFNFNFSKLIPFLRTTVKLNSNYSIFNFKNFVNNSTLRSNQSNYLTNEVFLKTAFKTKVNFENKTNYIYQETISESVFKNTSFQNKFKLLFKPSKQFYSDFTFEYFIPNLQNKSNNYSFISAKIWYKPKDKNWELNLSAKNLANVKSFKQFNTNDISTNINSVNLLNRFILLNFSYNF